MTRKISNILLTSIALIIIFGLTASTMQAQKKQTSLEGRWEITFTFQRNTKKPKEPSHSWLTFTLNLTQTGKAVKGELFSDATNGSLKGEITGNKFVGKMRLGWDKKDWESVTFTLSANGKTANGQAYSKVANDETHYYTFLLTRQTTAVQVPTVVQDSWQTFSPKVGGFSFSMPCNPEAISGNNQIQYLCSDPSNDNIAYLVIYTPFGQDTSIIDEREKFEALKYFVLRGGTVISSQNISTKGVPGLAYTRSQSGVTEYGKAFEVVSRRALYQIQFLIRDPKLAKTTVAKRTKFFASFKLK